MRRAVVTGANGFVGYWLIRELQKNNIYVTAVVKDQAENISMLSEFNSLDIVYCDLAEINTLKNKLIYHDYDLFYHLAWISAGGDGRADYNIQLKNVKYACDTVKVAAELNCNKILFAGTVTEKISENILSLHSKGKNNVYGICKHMTHCLVDIECRKYDINYVWMQFSNLYGPYSVNGNIVGYTIKELLNGNNAIFGPADQIYDLLYIEDLVHAAYLLGVNKLNHSCYYIGSGEPRILSSYLREIGIVCGMPDKILIGQRQDDGTKYKEEWFDISRLREDTGYTSQIGFQDGLIRTINWMKEIF